MAEYLFKTDNRITNCSDCSFVVDIKDREGIDENGKPVILKGCPFLRELVDLYFTSRHKFCPLVELPTPHGRLGDLDALKNSVTDMRMEKPLRNGAKQVIEIGKLFGQIIDDAETIVEATE